MTEAGSIKYIHKCACGAVARYHGDDGVNYCQACMDIYLNDEQYKAWLRFYERAKREHKV